MNPDNAHFLLKHNVVNRNVDDFHNETDKAHNRKSNHCGERNLLIL